MTYLCYTQSAALIALLVYDIYTIA